MKPATRKPHVVIVGGGAAGFFAAITCAENAPDARVTILERSTTVLQKVKISGGGRCNVTHACFDPKELIQSYPRGSRELLGPFMRFGPTETINWFEQRGVPLKTEEDGRMFPVSNSSQTIIDCLWKSAQKAGVEVQTGMRVEQLARQPDGQWKISISRHPDQYADCLMIAAGSSEAVWTLLGELGHTIEQPVPSLFTFNTKNPILQDMAGVSVPLAQSTVSGQKLQTSGPLLITHWGLSGPAILRLSAWGARALHDLNYHFDLKINWAGHKEPAEITDLLQSIKQSEGKKTIQAHPQLGLSSRLWQRLCDAAGIGTTLRWGDASKKSIENLATQIAACTFSIKGKSTFKEEFVTAGGVDLRNVNFKTFGSRLFPNLYFAGEILNIDAITGGYNFQAAWTGGWIAGHAMAEQLNSVN